MKKQFNFLKNTILLLGGGLVFLGLASCENFMKGSAVKDQLNDAIEIANSQAITYFVSVDKGSGEVTPASVSVKKKENFELIFIPEEDWQFICWETIDALTGKVVPDVIKFENPQKTQTKAYVINPKEKVLIHPKCVQLPAVVSVEPSKASYANTPITIKFNIPVEAEETAAEDSLFNFDNIKLTCNGVEVNYLFEKPVFNADKTELVIMPVVDQDSYEPVLLYDYIKNKLKVGLIEIKIQLKSDITVSIEENAYEITNKNFSVYYISSVDTQAPVGNLFVTRNEISIDNAESLPDSQRFHQKQILSKTGYTNPQYEQLVKQNICTGTIWIYGSYYDTDSGVKSVTVKEILTNDTSGQALSDSKYIITEYLKDNQNDNVVFRTDNNQVYFVIKHTFKTYTGQNEVNAIYDGAISLDISINDVCYNSSNEHFNVIRRSLTGVETVLWTSGDCIALDKYGIPEMDLTENWVDYNTYMTNYLEHLRSLIFYIPLRYSIYNGVKHKINGEQQDFFLSLEYIDINHKPKTVPLLIQESDYLTTTYTHKLVPKTPLTDFAIWPGTSVKIKYSDFLGNTEEVTPITFPSDTQTYYTEICQDEYSPNYFIKAYTSENNDRWPSRYKEYVLLRQKDNQIECIKQWKFERDAEEPDIILYEDADAKVLDPNYTYGIMIDGIIVKKCTITVNDLTPPPSVWVGNITEADYKNIDKKVNLFDVSLKINDQNNDGIPDYDYDYITCNDIVIPNVTKYDCRKVYEDIFSDYQDNRKIEVYGFKNNIKSEPTIRYLPQVKKSEITEQEDKEKYDRRAPSKQWQFNGSEIEITITDDWSGIASGYFTVHGKKYNITVPEKNQNIIYEASIKIPVLDFFTSTNDISPIAFELKDYAGNISSDQTTVMSMINGYYKDVVTENPDKPDTFWTEKHAASSYYFYRFNYDKNSEDYGFPKTFDYTNNYIDDSYGNGISNTDIRNYIGNNSETNGVYLDKTKDQYVKVFRKNYFGNLFCPNPLYYYCGTPGNKAYDQLFPYGSSKTSVIIGSDKPVYVHTLVSSQPLKECKTWDAVEWEYYKQEYGETIIDFDNSLFEIYDIPVDKINEGQCYVVIAHYSHNETKMSEVMVK